MTYQDWLNWQAQRLQAAGGNQQALMPQVTTTPQQVTPGFGIAVPTQPLNQLSIPMLPTPTQPTNYASPALMNQPIPQAPAAPSNPLPPPRPLTYQEQLLQAQQGARTPSSPTGFGLPPAGWGQSPAANQQYAQYGQLGAAGGQLGGQYGYLGATNAQRPAGTAAGAWSSSPTPAATGVPRIAAARTPSQYGYQTAPATGARIQGQGVPGGAVTPPRASTATTATPGGINLGSTGTGTAAETLQAYGQALPTPNKIVARNFVGLDPDTQDFLRSGYRAIGYSDNQINQAVKQGLPQFRLPGGTGQIRG